MMSTTGSRWTNALLLLLSLLGCVVCSGTKVTVPVSAASFGVYDVPPELSSWDQYPNVLNITDSDRESFHPVVAFPKIWSEDSLGKRTMIPNYSVMDMRHLSGTEGLASEDARRQARRRSNENAKENDDNEDTMTKTKLNPVGFDRQAFSVGRYDENRVAMYASEMFENEEHNVDGYNGRRTVHIGMDLQGPVGTKVFAFCDGRVHSAGYNPELGDYGNVIVIEHDLGEGRKLWALYGHLDDTSTKQIKTGDKIHKGQLLGRLGDIHENGGWNSPHVHFQLSIHPPESHDMPGVVAPSDRARALLEYPDPRLVLGPLY